MKKEKKDKNFVHRPSYPGGLRAMREFIRTHLRYPEAAQQHKIEGTIKAKYTIDARGKVIKVRLLNSLGHGCDEEAARVIKLLLFEVPKHRKLRVHFHKSINIHFRPPKSNAVSVKYQMKKSTSEKKPADKSYFYTITTN